MKLTLKGASFSKGWSRSLLKAQTNFARHPLQIPRNEKHHGFHEQWRNNPLLFNQSTLTSKQKALGWGVEGIFPSHRCQPLPSTKDPSAMCTNSTVSTCFGILATALLSHRHQSQVFPQSPLPPLFLYLFLETILWLWLFYLGSLLSQLLNKLQILQNTASKAISNCNATTSSKITSGYNTIHMHKLYRLWLS